ncbi:hypothetical protein F5146DRAFT_1125281 [Armillaria mellea]|nr:hypothetical protein F5146DRAFT_1125281 [Armillaria mellea]
MSGIKAGCPSSSVLFVSGFIPSRVPICFKNVMTASKRKGDIHPDMVNRRSAGKRWQSPIHLATDIAFSPFRNATALRPFAQIAEASSVPYLENVAKVAVVIFEALEQKGKNKEDAKELCESIANTIVVIDTLVRMQGERGALYFMGICGEMEGYLQGMAQDLKDTKRKHAGIKGILRVDDFRDTTQAYRKRVDDLKMEFLIQVTDDCLLEVMQMHCLLKDVMAQVVVRHSEEDFVIQIPKKKPAAISALFFFKPKPAGKLFKNYIRCSRLSKCYSFLIKEPPLLPCQ